MLKFATVQIYHSWKWLIMCMCYMLAIVACVDLDPRVEDWFRCAKAGPDSSWHRTQKIKQQQ